MSVMGKRILVGAILIAVTMMVLWLDWHMEQAGQPRINVGAPERTLPLRALPLTVMVVLLIAAGYRELARLSRQAGLPIFRSMGMLCAVAIGSLPFWRQVVSIGPYAEALMQLVLGGVVMLLFADQLIIYRTKDAIRRIGVSLLAVCYLGICGAVIIGIRMDLGLKVLVFFLLVVKVTDIGAYFFGTLLGRHKLVPWLSPQKTWEGLIGGLALAAAAGAGFVWVFNPIYAPFGSDLGPIMAAVIAVILGLFGQGADLCESAIKRDAGIKDAGRVFPAFGGVLDVIDSPLLAAPVAYVLLAAFC